MSVAAITLAPVNAWKQELRGFVRALSGALLFGVPLLYTMEMWWLGEIARPGQTLRVLGVTLLANAALMAAAGGRDRPLLASAQRMLRNVAVGIFGAAVVLVVLNQLTPDHSLAALVGMITAQALPLSLGAAVGDIIFASDREGAYDEGESAGVWHALLNDVSATAIGAVFVAASIAPTEEVPTISVGMDLSHLLALMGLTLLTGYLIVFASGFDQSAERDRQHLFQHPATETVLAYLVALIVAFGVLALSNQVSSTDPARYVLTQTLVLGLPAMVGGAAGRIAL